MVPRRRAGLTAALTLGFALVLTASPSAVSVADAQATCTATDQASLATCITMYNAALTGTTVSIAMTADITLASDLPTIDNAASPAAVLVLDGGGHTLDGDEVTREVLSQDAGDLRMSNLGITGAPSGRSGFSASGGSVQIVASAVYRNGATGISTGADLLVLRDSTVSENQGGGVVIFAGELQVQRSTIVTNGGTGILRFGGGEISLQGSILANHIGGDCLVDSVADLGGNVVDDASCGDIAATPGALSGLGDLDFGPCSPCTPIVTVLGPATEIIDANAACGAGLVDQRGNPRTEGKCDAGAFEVFDCESVLTALTDVDLRFSSGCFSNLPAGGTISVTLADDIQLSYRLILENEQSPAAHFVLNGEGHAIEPESASSSGDTDLRLLDGQLTVSNLTLRNQSFSSPLMWIRRGSALVEGVTFSGGSSGLIVESSELSVVRNSTIANNETGVLVEDGGALSIEQSSIVGNTVTGIELGSDGGVVLTGSLVGGNTGSECTGAGLIDLGGNAFEDSTCGGPATPDLAGSFGGLFDNGCVATPCTKTVGLLPGSPAIDLNTSCGAGLVDQRGTPRSAGACDAGSFELAAPAVCNGLTVTINMQLGALGIGTAGGDVILGTAGDDVIDAGDGNDTVCAGDGDDEVLGGDGNDMLFGEAGVDLMRGGPGNDTLEGGDGNDRILGGIGEDIMRGGPGNDYLGGFGGDDMIFGDSGNEIIFGGFGADTINGGPGNDTIRGLIGNDTINGGAGDDTLDGDRGNDTINGGAGDDVIGGGNANDILSGDDGDDSVSGGRADDNLSGGLGTDTCVGNKHINGDTADATCETVFGVP